MHAHTLFKSSNSHWRLSPDLSFHSWEKRGLKCQGQVPQEAESCECREWPLCGRSKRKKPIPARARPAGKTGWRSDRQPSSSRLGPPDDAVLPPLYKALCFYPISPRNAIWCLWHLEMELEAKYPHCPPPPISSPPGPAAALRLQRPRTDIKHRAQWQAK